MNSTYNQLCTNLDRLKLGQMKEKLNDTIEFITKNNLPFAEGLLKLSNYEVDLKEANASKSMIKAGAFPFQKGIEEFEFDFQPSINREQIQDFTTLRFLEHQENIVFLRLKRCWKNASCNRRRYRCGKEADQYLFYQVSRAVTAIKEGKAGEPLGDTFKAFLQVQTPHH